MIGARAAAAGAADPIVVQITAAGVVTEAALFARIAAVAALPPEARARFAVMLRDPELGGRELLGLGRRLERELDAIGAALWINDRLDLALALRARAVHLGRRSVAVADARALVGRSVSISVACHGLDDVRAAAAAGADVAVLSPVLASPGKGPPLGVAALSEARRLLASTPTRLLALGGVDAASALSCIAAGADGVAVIRADPAAILRTVVDAPGAPC